MAGHPQARIIGMGSYVPARILTNSELEKLVETSEEWIVTRTGIKERRIAADDEYPSQMGCSAALEALQQAQVAPSEIDLVISATVTGDFPSPSTAALIQSAIGASKAAAFDISAACSGYLYGLSLAKAYIESGMYRRILLVATEKMSAFVDYTDRNTCILFGDGAAAAVITGEGSGYAVDAISLGADGQEAELIIIPGGGSRSPTSQHTLAEKKHSWKMQGREVFKHAVRRMTAAAKECLASLNLTIDDMKWMVPHQANIRIIEATAKSAGLPMEKVYVTLHKYGNCSAPGVAIAMDELLKEEPLADGERLLLVVFGGGLTWGAAVLTKIQGEAS